MLPVPKLNIVLKLKGGASWQIFQGFCEEENGIKDWIMIMEHSRKLTIRKLFLVNLQTSFGLPDSISYL